MNNSINGWKIGLKYYFPCFGLSVVFLVCSFTYYIPLFIFIGIVLFAIGFFVFWFFRDFPRKITAKELEIVSPADGTIVEIKELDKSEYLSDKAIKISIFMSIFNAHVNRSPYDGRVKKIVYKKGKFFNAMKEKSSSENESNTIYLSTPEGDITIRQIAGLVARRIVCPLEEGNLLKKGQKLGMIQFGSRVEIFLPSDIVQINVKNGDKVYAGTTVIGSFVK